MLAPGYALLKEWAYAGFCFTLIGAIETHLFVADPVNEWLPPIIILGLGAASYVLRPLDRRIAPAS